MDEEIQRGDKALVIAETGDERFPRDAIVRVVEVSVQVGLGPPVAHVYRIGKGTIVDGALPVTLLQRIGR